MVAQGALRLMTTTGVLAAAVVAALLLVVARLEVQLLGLVEPPERRLRITPEAEAVPQVLAVTVMPVAAHI
jgi:hypothetical protein